MVNTAPGLGGGGSDDSGSSAPPSDSTGGAVSPSDPVEDAASDFDGGTGSVSDTRTVSGSTTVRTRPRSDPTGGVATPSREVEAAASTFDGGVDAVSDRSVSSSVPSVGVGSGPTAQQASGAFDGFAGRVGGGFETAQSTVGDISDRLPGRTGEAFAAGVGVAAVPEPTPVTEISGGALAGGAALVGGGILASRALRNRGGEVGIGERVSSELGIGSSQQDVAEVGVGGGRTGGEIAPGATGPSTTEVGLGATVGGSEIDVGDPTAGEEPTAPGVDAAGQVTIGEQRQVGDEQTTITREDLEGFERTDELEEDERLRQIREELERRQEFVRDEPSGGGRNRDPVRFPADEAATGTATGLGEQLEPDLNTDPAGVLGTATGAGGITDEFLAGTDREVESSGGATDGIVMELGDVGLPDVPGAGTEPVSDPQTEVETGTDTGGETGTGGVTDTGGSTATGTAEPTLFEDSVTVGAQQAATEAVPQSFATPETAALEEVFAEPAQASPRTQQRDRRRDRPREEWPGGDDDDSRDPLGFDIGADLFDSGFLSADEAAARFLR